MLRTRNFLLLALLAPLLLAAGSKRTDDLDRFILAQMARRQIPGLSLAIIQEGKIVEARDASGAVTGLRWTQNGRERIIPRVGPLIESLQRQPDPDTALAARILSTLNALTQGGDGGCGTSPSSRPRAWRGGGSSGTGDRWPGSHTTPSRATAASATSWAT